MHTQSTILNSELNNLQETGSADSNRAFAGQTSLLLCNSDQNSKRADRTRLADGNSTGYSWATGLANRAKVDLSSTSASRHNG